MDTLHRGRPRPLTSVHSDPGASAPPGPPPDLTPLYDDAEFSRIYTVQGQIGAGAFSMVVRALHKPTGRVVALKGLTALTASESVERFLREGRMMAKLSHPHIVRVYDVGVGGGIPYMALELVEGGTLETVDPRPWDIGEALRLMFAVAGALGHCHRRGITHRDLKPANILRDADGNPRVADFGLAQSSADSLRLTAEGTVMGTPRYMAPEAVVGDPIGPAADVYAVGVILYELLAARGPFDAISPQDFLVAHAYAEPRPLMEFRPDAPASLLALIDRCLAKQPEKRPADGGELADALSGIAIDVMGTLRRKRSETLRSRPKPTPEPEIPPELSSAAFDLRPDERSAKIRAELGLRAASPAASRLATILSLTVTALLLAVFMIANRQSTPVAAARDSAASQLEVNLLGRYAAEGGVITRLAFSPDGSRLVAGGGDGNLRCYDLAAQASRPRTLEASGPVQDLSCSGGGRFVASLSASGQATLVDMSKSNEASIRRLLAPARALSFIRTTGPTQAAQFDRLLLVGPDLAVRLLDPAGTGTGLAFPPPAAAGPERTVRGVAAIAAQGAAPRLLYVLTSAAGQLDLVRLELLDQLVRTTRAATWMGSVTLAALGSATERSPAWLAIARTTTGPVGDRHLVEAYELGAEVKSFRPIEPPVVPRAVLAAPVPGYLVVGGPAGEVAIALLAQRGGESLADWRSWIAHPAAVTALALHQDGRLLATAAADGSVNLWGIRRGRRTP